MLVFGFASVTSHTIVAVSPSITLYRLDRMGLISGLSDRNSCYNEYVNVRCFFVNEKSDLTAVNNILTGNIQCAYAGTNLSIPCIIGDTIYLVSVVSFYNWT